MLLWSSFLAVSLQARAALSADERPPAAANSQSDVSPVDLAELPLLWQAQRDEIATAEIRFYCFDSTFENPQNTPEHVGQLLARHDLAARPEELEVFLEDLTGRTFEARKPWDDMVLTVSGNRRRVDGRFCQFVTDGALEAVFTPTNRQLDLKPVGRSLVRHYRLDDLRHIPSQRVRTDSWQYLRSVNGAAVYNVPPVPDGPQFEVLATLDPGSGIVTHSITRHPDGLPAIERYQSGLSLHASGVLFPRLRVDLTYANGTVSMARVMLVQHAEFNGPISDEAFLLAAPAGTRVVDYRGPDKEVWIASTGVADALALPVRPTTTVGVAAPIARPARPGRADTWWWLLAGVHLVGVLGAIILFRRRRRSALTRTTTSEHQSCRTSP